VPSSSEARLAAAAGLFSSWVRLLAEGALGLAHAPGEARDKDVRNGGHLDGHPAEGLGVDPQDTGRCHGPRPVDGGSPREHREPARELSGPVVYERNLLRAVEARDVYPTLQNNVEAVHGGGLVEEKVACLQNELLTVRPQRLDLLGRESLFLLCDAQVVGGAHHAPASILRSLPIPASASGPSTGSRTWKRVSPGSERTRMSPLWSSTITR
jgi:hypothetical protein